MHALSAVLSLALAADPSPPVPEAPAADPGFGEEIVVVGHYQNSIGSSGAASAGSFSRQLLEDRPFLRPGEVLELVPGLVITQHSGAGKANQYFLRGFNLDHGTDFLTTLDGMPLNLRTHAHGQGYTDLNFLIPELVDRVAYYKGPYYASKGDFGSAGAADLHYAESLPEHRLRVTGGSNLHGRTLLTGSPELGEGRLLYALELFHDDGPWRSPDDYRRLNGVLRYARHSGETRWNVTAMGYDGRWNATDQVPLRAVASGDLDRFAGLDPTTGGKTQRFSLSGGLSTPAGPGALTVGLYAVRYRLNLFSNFTYFLDDPVHGDQFEQADDRVVLGTSGSWTVAGQGERPARLTLGWEGRHDRIDPVGLYATEGRQRLRTIRQDLVRETSGGLFGEAEASLAPWLRATAGLRYDLYAFDVVSDEPANSGREVAGRLSPKLSAVAGPWARTELFVNLGAGFHSNDARGITTTLDPRTREPVAPVTPLAGTRGAELGVRSEVLPGVQSSLALWRLDLASELVFVGDAGTTEPSRPSRREGVEWSTRWQPRRWLLFDLDVALSRARFTDRDPAGDHIPGAIASALSAGATVRDLGPFTASAFLRWFGPRPLVEDGSVRSAGSAIVNAQLGFRLSRSIRLGVEVFNLLDGQVDDIAYLYPSRLRGEPAQGVSDIHFHPAERRSVRASLELGF